MEARDASDADTCDDPEFKWERTVLDASGFTFVGSGPIQSWEDLQTEMEKAAHVRNNGAWVSE